MRWWSKCGCDTEMLLGFLVQCVANNTGEFSYRNVQEATEIPENDVPKHLWYLYEQELISLNEGKIVIPAGIIEHYKDE